jgi:ankyrin repeat protein
MIKNKRITMLLILVLILLAILSVNSLRSASTDVYRESLGGNLKRVTLLISQDPSLINQKDGKGYSPLHYAAGGGGEDIARYLLSMGANPNIQDNEGMTPLHIAAGRGSTEVVKLLLEGGGSDHQGPGWLDTSPHGQKELPGRMRGSAAILQNQC